MKKCILQLCSLSIVIFFTTMGLFNALLIPSKVCAENSKKTKPKIGLVLSGGGALGFAHVGVLKVLEENRIPVHMIAGTSMGALVGAAYASGIPMSDIEELAISTDWTKLFDETSPRSKLAYRLKSGRNHMIFSNGKVGIKDGTLVLPSGLLGGKYTFPVLQDLYSRVPNPVNFSELPVPFRAVAADIENGEAVILTKGDLSKAVRASISVPGIFTPIEIDGKLLVDGGIVNNLPVDQVIDMGADIIIVVAFDNERLKSKEELKSSLDIAFQVLNLMLKRNSETQIEKMRAQDILLIADVVGYSGTDFAESAELMKRGEEAARNIKNLLQRLSVTKREYLSYKKNREQAITFQRIEFIHLKNDSEIPDNIIMKDFNVHVGDILDRNVVKREISKIYNLGYFSQVDYDFLRQNGKHGIILTVKGKPWLEEYLQVGLSVEDDFQGDAFYTFGVNYHKDKINRYGGYLDIRGQIGKTLSIESEFFEPFGKESPYFIIPLISAHRSNLFIRRNRDIVARYDRYEALTGLTIGRKIPRSGEVHLGIRRGFGNFEVDVGDPYLPESDYDIGETFTGVVIDTLDSPDFPASGISAKLSYNRSLDDLGASNSFDQMMGEAFLPISWGENTVALNSAFALTPNKDQPLGRYFSLGGFLDVSGFKSNSLYTSDFITAQTLFYRHFYSADMVLLKLDFLSGGSIEISHLKSDFRELEDLGSILSGSVFIGIDTPFLPLRFGFGLAEEGNTSLYLTIGRIKPRH